MLDEKKPEEGVNQPVAGQEQPAGVNQPNAGQEKPDGDEINLEMKIPIKVGGENKEVTLKELVELGQQGFDYTKKTQDLAALRKNIDAEILTSAERVADEKMDKWLKNLLDGGKDDGDQITFDDPKDKEIHDLKLALKAVAEKVDQGEQRRMNEIEQAKMVEVVSEIKKIAGENGLEANKLLIEGYVEAQKLGEDGQIDYIELAKRMKKEQEDHDKKVIQDYINSKKNDNKNERIIGPGGNPPNNPPKSLKIGSPEMKSDIVSYIQQLNAQK